jgi:RimJ/RimL family protein N-acetyltransferase
VLDALIANDRVRASRLVGFALPSEFPSGDDELLRLRRAQLAERPGDLEWLLRAIVRREDGAVVGFVNFHGPPGTNDIAAPEAAELGWTVFPAYRRRGYATEVARTLMDWAAREHAVRRFISSTTPDNAASLRVHAKLGFIPTGEIVEGEVIFELRVTTPPRATLTAPRSR